MKRSTIGIFGAIIVIGVILVAGAYTAGQLLAEPESEAEAAAGGSNPGARVLQSVEVGNDGVPVSVQTTILPAPELPQEEAAAFGIVVDRLDDTVTIGTGAIEVNVDVEVDPETGQETASVVPSTNGPELEVVLTNETVIFRDVTDIAGQMPDESGEVTITQEIRPVTDPDQITDKMELQVWGERRGDRIVADVVVFGPLGGGAFD